ncbi:MAG: hypothetical protein ACXW27_08940 [Allosphingosinicella sp.]
MPRNTPFVAYVDTVPDFREKNGRVFYTPVGGGEEDLRCMPIPVFRAWIEAGQALLDEWDARQVEPVPLKRKG